jgi:hypothetical protein
VSHTELLSSENLPFIMTTCVQRVKFASFARRAFVCK